MSKEYVRGKTSPKKNSASRNKKEITSQSAGLFGNCSWKTDFMNSSPKSSFASQLACSFRDSQGGEQSIAQSEIFTVTRIMIIEIAIVCYLISCILSSCFSSLSPRLGPINPFERLVKQVLGTSHPRLLILSAFIFPVFRAFTSSEKQNA